MPASARKKQERRTSPADTRCWPLESPKATLHLAGTEAGTQLQLDLTRIQNTSRVPFQLQALLSCGTSNQRARDRADARLSLPTE